VWDSRLGCLRRQAGRRSYTMPFERNAYEYRRHLPHIEKANRPHFITFRTYEQLHLPPAARDVVMRHCFHDNGTKIDLHAAAVLPTHVHLVFTPLRDENGAPFLFRKMLGGIKGASAHSVNSLLGRTGSVWQDESFDHVLRSEEKLEDAVDYVWLNAVRHGLARLPWEYKWVWKE
jgi:REP element-mobilizing transposase RayT